MTKHFDLLRYSDVAIMGRATVAFLLAFAVVWFFF
jgi:hypothetical protein